MCLSKNGTFHGTISGRCFLDEVAMRTSLRCWRIWLAAVGMVSAVAACAGENSVSEDPSGDGDTGDGDGNYPPAGDGDGDGSGGRLLGDGDLGGEGGDASGDGDSGGAGGVGGAGLPAVDH